MGALAIEQLRVGAKYPMAGIPRLLRARRERQCSHDAAQKRDAHAGGMTG